MPGWPPAQEEVCDRGLLSLFLAREARDPEKGQLSVMQVGCAAVTAATHHLNSAVVFWVVRVGPVLCAAVLPARCTVAHATNPWAAAAHMAHPCSCLCPWQVKDASGSWQDVVLSPGEVAVLLGLTMQHATAGVLTPGTYRVVRVGAGALWWHLVENCRAGLQRGTRPAPEARPGGRPPSHRPSV